MSQLGRFETFPRLTARYPPGTPLPFDEWTGVFGSPNTVRCHIDAVHPLFGQPLEVSPSGLIRRIGWIRVVLPDGRHRWVPQIGTAGSNPTPSSAASGPNRRIVEFAKNGTKRA